MNAEENGLTVDEALALVNYVEATEDDSAHALAYKEPDRAKRRAWEDHLERAVSKLRNIVSGRAGQERR